MCLVKTLLGKTLWEKILVKEKEYTYLLIRTICCLIKNLARKNPVGKNLGQGKKSATRIILPWLKHHLISCDNVSNLRTLWLVYSFSKKNHTFLEYGVSLISTRRIFDLLYGGLLFLHSNICFIDRQYIIVPPHANT